MQPLVDANGVNPTKPPLLVSWPSPWLSPAGARHSPIGRIPWRPPRPRPGCAGPVDISEKLPMDRPLAIMYWKGAGGRSGTESRFCAPNFAPNFCAQFLKMCAQLCTQFFSSVRPILHPIFAACKNINFTQGFSMFCVLCN